MRRLFRNPSERGFTLIELLVVIIVISILAAIAIPVFLSQQRTASLATVKADIRNAVPLLSPTENGANPTIDAATFAAKVRTSKDNTLSLVMVDGDNGQQLACIQGYHTFSASDKQYFAFFSSTGRLVPGDCYGGTTGTGSGTTSPNPSTSAAPSASATPTTQPVSSVTNNCDGTTTDAGASYNCTYAPQTNKLAFCDTLKVSGTTGTAYAWRYSIDVSKAPFYGANPNGYTSVYGIQTVSFTNNIWTIKGAGYNDNVSSGTDTTVGWCVDPQDPGVAASGTYTVDVTYTSGGGSYYACIDVKASTTSKYPLVWGATVDLKQYFKNFQANPVSISSRLNASNQGNYVYKIEGVTGDSRYVSATTSQSIGNAFCVNAGGADWKA